MMQTFEYIDDTSPTQKRTYKNVLVKYLAAWPLFFLLLIVSLVCAWLYLKVKVPVYKTSATLMIKDEKRGSDQSRGLEALNIFNSNKLVENEIEILKSKMLARDVATNLHLYADVYQEGQFSDHSAYSSSPVIIIAQDPTKVLGCKKKPFIYDEAKQQVSFDHRIFPLNRWIKTRYGIIQFTQNPKYEGAEPGENFYYTLTPIKKKANEIVDKLNVNASNKLSTIVLLEYKDENPVRGEDVMTELVNVYKQATLTDKNRLAENTLHFVEERLGFVVNELDSIERKMQSYKARNNIVDISTEGKVFLENVGSNDQRIGDISLQMAILGQVENYVTGKGTQGGIVPSTAGLSDPVLSNLLDKLYNAELEYEKMKKVAPVNNPVLVSISDQVEKIKPNILENIRTQKRSLEAGRRNLSSTNNAYVSKMRAIPEKERELLEISRQQAIKSNIYNFLLEKREEAALSYASTVGDFRQVDQPLSSEYPVSPNPLIVYLGAVFSAFSMGIVVVFARGSLNNKIDSREELMHYINMPIVGELVYNTSKDKLVVENNKPSLIAEQFRHIRTSLNYLGINSGTKKILVTSSIANEGKSFIAANIASSLALNNKKAALLELDLRKPNREIRKPGLTEYLEGKIDVFELFEHAEITGNLTTLSAGRMSPNPSELLGNGRLEELIAFMQANLDYIVIDSSPVIPVTDAYLLSPLCDLTLYIIRQGVTPVSIMSGLNDRFLTKRLKNVAVVFNGIKEKGLNKYYYDYSYGNKRADSHKKSWFTQGREN